MTPSTQDVSQRTKTCKRGHIYDATKVGCPVCMDVAVRRWAKNNKELISKRRSENYYKNREKFIKRHQDTKDKYTLRRIWRAMWNRCNNPKHTKYSFYGGRGITVCDRWSGENGFENFKNDMGERPSPLHEIDRRDNSLGYAPDNCHWVTPDVQARNKRSNRNITYNGKTQCLTDWAKELGMSRITLLKRIRMGWDEIEALTRPVDHRFTHPRKPKSANMRYAVGGGA